MSRLIIIIETGRLDDELKQLRLLDDISIGLKNQNSALHQQLTQAQTLTHMITNEKDRCMSVPI